MNQMRYLNIQTFRNDKQLEPVSPNQTFPMLDSTSLQHVLPALLFSSYQILLQLKDSDDSAEYFGLPQ